MEDSSSGCKSSDGIELFEEEEGLLFLGKEYRRFWMRVMLGGGSVNPLLFDVGVS